jgi:hypothetical protein
MEKFATMTRANKPAQVGWEEHCLEKKIPCVIIFKHKNGLAEVSWNSGSYDEAGQDALERNRDELLADFKEIKRMYATPKSEVKFNICMFNATDIHFEDAPKMAEEVFETVNAMVRHRK